MWWKNIFFDNRDRELKGLVNKLTVMDASQRHELKIFDSILHPHGIKTLAISLEIRVAQAVVKLLDSLEGGQVADRLHALRILYDEVLNSSGTSLRRNTARVLIQIMKDMVRARNHGQQQLMLAHDFRRATTGNTRIIRKLLNRYHLVEMPEDWNQLSFDHHVHDSNTKGRKNPTHLIMDAWLKGIRHLTIIYYNYVKPEVAMEVLTAAEIMGISVRIGLEYAVPFRGRYVHFIWIPRGFADLHGFLEFLADPAVKDLMKKGLEASKWVQKYVFTVLEQWNTTHLPTLEKEIGISLPVIDISDFHDFVSHGQASILHLAEYIFTMINPFLEKRSQDLYSQCENINITPEQRIIFENTLSKIEKISIPTIHESWLTPAKNPDIPSPYIPSNSPDTPEIMLMSPIVLLDWLTCLNPGYRITLNLAQINTSDVLELLWQCEGLITHLEIFNLKEWIEGRLTHIEDINKLQLAINHGSTPRLKQLIRNMIKNHTESNQDDKLDRVHALKKILLNIPTLQNFYKNIPLRSRIGTDSTSRTHNTLGMGMGMVFTETLTPRGQHFFAQPENIAMQIPVFVEINQVITYKTNPEPRLGILLTKIIRKIPGFKYFGYIRKQEWFSHSASCVVGKTTNIAPLGGTIPTNKIVNKPPKFFKKLRSSPDLFYLNTSLSNFLKVLVGFIPAFYTFQYTQSWWFLAWFGAIIWFLITGLRNIIQAVMAGQGLYHSTLLRWNNHVSWSRLCDSLMYTGFSVILLELGIRLLLLQDFLGYTVNNNSVLVFVIMAIANGLYISSHNIYRGLPKEAIIGNLFRSALSIPIAIIANKVLLDLLIFMEIANAHIIMQNMTAIIYKTLSDIVAAVIEGFADRQNNMRIRAWDYSTKLKQIFGTYTKIELLFPEEDALAILSDPKQFITNKNTDKTNIKIETIINALDLMYFWFYQPRAQDAFKRIIKDLSTEERIVIAKSQLVLTREREVSQLFVDGMLGRHFARPLSFYLDRNEDYLRIMKKLCAVNKQNEK